MNKNVLTTPIILNFGKSWSSYRIQTNIIKLAQQPSEIRKMQSPQTHKKKNQ